MSKANAARHLLNVPRFVSTIIESFQVLRASWQDQPWKSFLKSLAKGVIAIYEIADSFSDLNKKYYPMKGINTYAEEWINSKQILKTQGKRATVLHVVFLLGKLSSVLFFAKSATKAMGKLFGSLHSGVANWVEDWQPGINVPSYSTMPSYHIFEQKPAINVPPFDSGSLPKHLSEASFFANVLQSAVKIALFINMLNKLNKKNLTLTQIWQMTKDALTGNLYHKSNVKRLWAFAFLLANSLNLLFFVQEKIYRTFLAPFMPERLNAWLGAPKSLQEEATHIFPRRFVHYSPTATQFLACCLIAMRLPQKVQDLAEFPATDAVVDPLLKDKEGKYVLPPSILGYFNLLARRSALKEGDNVLSPPPIKLNSLLVSPRRAIG